MFWTVVADDDAEQHVAARELACGGINLVARLLEAIFVLQTVGVKCAFAHLSMRGDVFEVWGRSINVWGSGE